MNTMEMYEVQLSRDGRYVCSFWVMENGVEELQKMYELEGVILTILQPASAASQTPSFAESVYKNMTEEEKRRAHAMQVDAMIRGGA